MASKPRKNGLAAFGAKQISPPPSTALAIVAPDATAPAGRAKTKNLTLRLTRDQWRHVRELALGDERSVQQLLIDLLAQHFKSRGLRF